MAEWGNINIVISRDAKLKLTGLMKDYVDYTRQMYIDVIKEEGALTCREAMVYSPPLDGQGGGKGDKKIAERWGNFAVERDIRSFVVPKERLLEASIGSQADFIKWKNTPHQNFKGNNSIIAQIARDANIKRAYQAAKNLIANKKFQDKVNVLKTESEIKSKHDEFRKLYRGRIRKNGGPKLMIPYVGDKKIIDAYIKKRQERVGWMKSGWLDTIRKIGPATINGIPKNFGLKDMPQWITRHVNASGLVDLKVGPKSDGGIVLYVSNTMGDIFGVSTLAQTIEKVSFVRGEKMFKRLQHFQNAAIDSFNNGRKPS